MSRAIRRYLMSFEDTTARGKEKEKRLRQKTKEPVYKTFSRYES
jgi:hypothetical protein